MSAALGVLGAIAWLLILVGVARGLRVYLDWRDARALQDFDAQCMLANAEAFRDLRVNSPYAYARDGRGYLNPDDLDPCDRGAFYGDDGVAA